MKRLEASTYLERLWDAQFAAVWRRAIRVLLSAVMVAACVPTARAAGEGEINAACAAVGCFPGDAAGYPVTISVPGSYRLTGPLAVAATNDTAIQLTTSDVVLDLGGFKISGPGGTATGFGFIGFGVFGDSARNVTVRNGFIVAMGRDSVSLGDDALVENVTSKGAGRDGIDLGNRAVIRHCTVTGSADDGIVVESGSRVDANVVSSSGDNGIVVGEGSFVTRNVASTSQDLGLVVLGNADPVVYSKNVFRFNNGGDTNPQVAVTAGPAYESSPNVCGANTTCP